MGRILFAVILFSFFLLACDNGGSGTAIDYSDIVTLQTEVFDDLPNCSKNREGNLAEVQGERKAYRCLDGVWEFDHDVYDTVLTEDDLPLCTGKKEGYSFFVQMEHSAYTCDGKRWTVIENRPIGRKDSADRSEDENRNNQANGSSNSIRSSSSFDIFFSAESSSSSFVESSSSFDGKDSSYYDAQRNTLTDFRDGHVYRTVTIKGTDYFEIWMAENLNHVYSVKPAASACHYNDESRCSVYGRLYDWSAALDSAGIYSQNGIGCGMISSCKNPSYVTRGLCPKGWHLPTKEEWRALGAFVGGSGATAAKLKSTTGWSGSGNGTDDYGFSVLPAGRRPRDTNGGCMGDLDSAYFWTADEASNIDAYYVYLASSDKNVYLYYRYKSEGLSVRCLKDEVSESSSSTTVSSSSSAANSSSSGNGSVGPTGNLVSCQYSLLSLGEFCDEFAESYENELRAQCDELDGVMGNGCKGGYREKCSSEKVNAYIYSGSVTCDDMSFD